jgi:hypothetical protein
MQGQSACMMGSRGIGRRGQPFMHGSRCDQARSPGSGGAASASKRTSRARALQYGCSKRARGTRGALPGSHVSPAKRNHSGVAAAGIDPLSPPCKGGALPTELRPRVGD